MATWVLTKRGRFEASHLLPRHTGKCQRLHGHSWVVEVEVTGDRLKTAGSETDMVMDFGIVGEITKTLIDDKLDHYHLNDTTGLANPTSEALAEWIFRQIEHFIPENAEGASVPRLTAVTVEETCTSRACYRP